MADDKPKVALKDCEPGEVWDKKLAKEVPGLVDAALNKAIRSGVELVSKPPADGFKVSPSVDLSCHIPRDCTVAS
jgi:hypothetical protein